MSTIKSSRPILGESPIIKEMLRLIDRVAQAKTNVLIIGESGTGKELVARMIHESGPLKLKPFIPINCGAIPETLIESELFGHRKGSFTGAVNDKQGLFEVAQGGTLFLDEVGDLPMAMQVKILRAIQEKSFRKVGGTEDIRVDVRIIAATHRDLEQGIQQGKFREDLYYRLNVIQIRTPPLRERKSDIVILAEHFLSKFNEKQSKQLKGFKPEVLEKIKNYPWPGNVRELENVIERAVTLESTSYIGLDVLPVQTDPKSSRTLNVPAPDFSQGPIFLDEILGEIEKTYLLAALESAGGTKKKAAELLGITFRSIRYRLKKLGVDTQDGDIDGEDEAGDES